DAALVTALATVGTAAPPASRAADTPATRRARAGNGILRMTGTPFPGRVRSARPPRPRGGRAFTKDDPGGRPRPVLGPSSPRPCRALQQYGQNGRLIHVGPASARRPEGHPDDPPC